MNRMIAAIAWIAWILSANSDAVRASDPGTYRIGAASSAITPNVAPGAPPVWLAGYGMARRAEAVHDDVYARALFIHDGQFGLALSLAT